MNDGMTDVARCKREQINERKNKILYNVIFFIISCMQDDPEANIIGKCLLEFVLLEAET